MGQPDSPKSQDAAAPQPPSPGSHKRPIKAEEQKLLDELKVLTEQYGDQFPSITSFVQKEAERITKGYKSAEEEKVLDIEGGKPVRMTYKVTVPTEKYPNFNYVGRLLGPKGSTLKGMQEISGCKLAVLGRGSMRDKDQEEKCRLEGGKYAHLNEPLHIWMQAYGTPDVVFYKLYVACKEVKRYLHADYNDDIFNEQMALLEQEGTLPKGYTAARAPRGARGVAAHRGMLPGGRGLLAGHRGLVPAAGLPRGAPGVNAAPNAAAVTHLPMRGGMRGGVLRGGGRGGRGGVRTGRGGHRVGPETLHEDMYEGPPPYTNGSAMAAAASAYFEEFPEPGKPSANEPGIPGFQRQNPNNKNMRLKNHQGQSSAATVATPTGAAAASVPVSIQQQKAY